MESGAVPVSQETIDKICNRWDAPEAWVSKGEGQMTFNKNARKFQNESIDPWKELR